MNTTPEQLAEWKALVPKLLDDSSDHMGVAHSTDMPPEHTVNFRHAKNTHEAAWAITNLIADLEEARRRSSITEAFAKELSSDLIATRKLLAEAQALIEPYRKDAERYRQIFASIPYVYTICVYGAPCIDKTTADAFLDQKLAASNKTISPGD
jgi:hypothetical protein